MILRALVLLLALFASSAAPEVRLTRASEVTASELSSAQHAILDGNPTPSAAVPLASPPEPGPSVAPRWGQVAIVVADEVVLVARPRAPATARMVWDQRAHIQRFRPKAPRFDAAPPVA